MENPPTYQELLTRVQALEQQLADSKPVKNLLDSNETLVNMLIETIPDPVWLKDPHGVYLACNRKFEIFFGATQQEIIGKTDYDFVSTEQADFFRKNDLQAIANGRPTSNEEEITYVSDGHTELVETVKTPMYDHSGNLIGVLGIARDITARKHIERELKFAKERLQLALEAANIGIWDWQVATDTWYVSPTYHTMLGYDPIGGLADRETWINRVHPDDRAMVLQKISAIQQGDADEYSYEARMLHANGTYRWHSVIGYVLERDEQRKPIHRTGVRIDIDDRVKADAERTRLQTQLTQAQKMEAIGRLAGGVAHDFNNMLSIILGQSELALDGMPQSDPTFRSLQGIKRAAEKSANLTRQLLAFARKQSISPKIICLNDVLANMINMLRHIIGEDIELIWRPGKDLWSIKMDTGQIDQILANLCVNARDSIFGVGRIAIETANAVLDLEYCRSHPGFTPGEYVKLVVHDNGNGIAPHILDKIFEPFFTTKDEGRGTGLGLSTVYGIVRQNDGFIDVYSEPGHGAAFSIYLPRYTTGATGTTDHDVVMKEIKRGTETILLVEDNAELLKISQTMLEKNGYNVLAAASCRHALELATHHIGTIDLLVTDVIMPEMNGKDLFDSLTKTLGAIKVLFMSGYTANIITPHVLLEKHIHFLEKPFSERELLNKVRSALNDISGDITNHSINHSGA